MFLYIDFFFQFLHALNDIWAMSLAVRMVGLDARKEIGGSEEGKWIRNRCEVNRKGYFERVGGVVSE